MTSDFADDICFWAIDDTTSRLECFRSLLLDSIIELFFKCGLIFIINFTGSIFNTFNNFLNSFSGNFLYNWSCGISSFLYLILYTFEIEEVLLLLLNKLLLWTHTIWRILSQNLLEWLIEEIFFFCFCFRFGLCCS